MGFNFNGADTLIDVGNPASLDNIFGSPGGSVSLWINPVTFGDASLGRLFDKSSGSAGWNLFIRASGANGTNTVNFIPRFSTTNGNWKMPNNTIVTDTWQHIGMTYDGSSTSNDPIFYYDGALVTTTENTAPVGTIANDSALDLIVGDRAAADRTFNGIFADVHLFDRILSAAEMQNMFACEGHDQIVRGLQLHYDLFGESVTIPATVHDRSPNGNTGTVTGSSGSGYVPDLLSIAPMIG